MTDLRHPISTVALLATVGVSNALGQTFEELPVTSAGSSAGFKVTLDDSLRWGGARSLGPSGSAARVTGLDRGWLLDFGDPSGRPSLPFAVPEDQHFWCFAAGAFTASPGFGSVAQVVRPSLAGLFAVGWGSCCDGWRFGKVGEIELISPPDGHDWARLADVSADGSIAVGTAGIGTDPGAIVWDGTAATRVEPSPSHATTVAPDGLSVGGMIDEGGGMKWMRWRFDTDSYVPDPPPVAIPGTLRGMSDNGNHLVGSLDDGTAAAWIDGTGLVTFGAGDALAVTDDGSIVIGTDRDRAEAWIWTSENGLERLSDYFGNLDLPPSSLPLLAGAGVSADGRFMTGWMGALDHVEEGDAPSDPLGSPPDTSAFTITGSLDGGADPHDVYGIVITDPDSFYATTSPTVDGRASAGFDTRLWLFDASGLLIMGNDDGPGGAPFLSTICDPEDFAELTGGVVDPTAPGSIEPGTYWLVVSGYPANPLDGQGVAVADLDSDFDALHGVNPASTGFFGNWSGAEFTGAGYTIALRGVTSTLPQRAWVADLDPGCREDLDGSGAVDFADILRILGAWGNAGGPEDLDDSGFVDFGDILAVLAAWGPCE